MFQGYFNYSNTKHYKTRKLRITRKVRRYMDLEVADMQNRQLRCPAETS